MDRRSRGGRRDDAVKVERSRSRSRSPRGRDRSRDKPGGARLANKRVYISNIPYDSRWQDIKDLFRTEVGEVAFVELFNDENDKPRGCGIIEFENSATAKKAIEKMHRHEMGGRKIVVKEDFDVERDKQGRIITGNNRSKEDRSDRDRSRDRVVILRDRASDREWDREDQVGSQGTAKFVNTYGLSQTFLESLGIEGQLIPKVFVSNLDFRADEKKLKEVFRLAGRVLDVDLNKDKDGKSRGHGVIEYEHPVEAVQAISMFNNQQLYERRMHVKMDRLADPLADLAKNRLPEGLRSIGMGLGENGQPLVDVSRNISTAGASTNSSLSTVFGNAATQANAATNSLASMNALAALNVNSTFGNLASLMSNAQGLDSLGGMSTQAAAAALAASNAFGVAGINPMGALNTAGNQFGNLGANNPGSLAAAMQSGLASLQGNQTAANNPMSLMGNSGAQIGTSSGIGGSGLATSTPNTQQSPFQTNQPPPGQTGGSGLNMRDIDYGYSTSVYSTPSSNFGGANKPSFGNGVGGGNVNTGGANSVPSNTVIVANLPQSCTWQMLKTKFRECGEVVFAEMRDKSTGIVRFATERDAERAVKVFDQSRVDGRIVEVRFLELTKHIKKEMIDTPLVLHARSSNFQQRVEFINK